jgi:biofilm PGA synthesis N-glycosyltransferase PgaC
MDYLGKLFSEAIIFLLYVSWDRFFAVFWPFIILDCGRYLTADFAVFTRAIFSPPNPLEEEFGRRLLDQCPLISVIIPAHNEAQTIEFTVVSVLEQTLTNLQIIVVDDGSQDETTQICRRLESREQRVSLLRNDQRVGKFSSQNLALNFCQGDYVIILDSDCSLQRDAFFEALKKFYDPDVGAISCSLRARNSSKNLVTLMQDFEYLTSISVGRISQAWVGTLFIVSGGYGVFRRKALANVGGYDVHTGEDGDLTIKIRKAGWKIAFAPRSLCLTNVPDSLWSLIRQRLRWDNCLINIPVRKHKNIYNPFNAGFTWSTFFGGLDNVFFQAFLNFIFFVYLIYIYAIFNEMVLVVLVSVYLVYFMFSSLQFAIALALSNQKREDLWLIFYLPLVPLYQNFILRPIRLIAHIGEILFRYTYKVSYIPPWVGKGTIRW